MACAVARYKGDVNTRRKRGDCNGGAWVAPGLGRGDYSGLCPISRVLHTVSGFTFVLKKGRSSV